MSAKKGSNGKKEEGCTMYLSHGLGGRMLGVCGSMTHADIDRVRRKRKESEALKPRRRKRKKTTR